MIILPIQDGNRVLYPSWWSYVFSFHSRIIITKYDQLLGRGKKNQPVEVPMYDDSITISLLNLDGSPIDEISIIQKQVVYQFIIVESVKSGLLKLLNPIKPV